MLRPVAGKTQTLADFNNERKFEFIAQVEALDYREKTTTNNNNNKEEVETMLENCANGKTSNGQRNNEEFPKAVNNNNNNKSSAANARSTRLPWLKDKLEEPKPMIPVCDVVTRQVLPKAAYIHSDSDDSMANTTDDSIAEELNLSNINYEQDGAAVAEAVAATGNANGTHKKNGIGAHLINNNSNDSVLMKSSIDLNESSPSLDSCVDKAVDLFESDNLINPKNEREVSCLFWLLLLSFSNCSPTFPQLWSAFQEQRALLHKLRREMQKKDERIEELEDFIAHLNPNDFEHRLN